MQLRTFDTLRKLHADKDTLRRQDALDRLADATRAAAPFHLGESVRILETVLSPDAHWLVVVTESKSAAPGLEGKLTRYVTESGYEEPETERLRVGRNPPAPQSLWLLDLRRHVVHPLPLDGLPGIHDDPLKAVREENAQRAAVTAGTAATAATAATPQTAAITARGVLIFAKDPHSHVGGIRWSRDAGHLAIMARAIDNKDRWVASVDFEHFGLVPQHRESNAAWAGTRFNDFGWLADDATLWYQSEESGYGHLYVKPPDGAVRAVTTGAFEVSDPVLSADGRWFYALANAESPVAYDVYRVAVAGGPLQRLTRLEGVEAFSLEHTSARLLVTHSTSYMPAQLAITAGDGGGGVRELTDTRSTAYKAHFWLAPEFVTIPSSHGGGTLYAKVYRPAVAPADGALRPAVIFVHGAGYLQDVHHRFPTYFREQMFHNLLVQRGYAVIDVDYRGSAGYGSAWRTAIYRQMGHPELEDVLDGKRWLVEHAGVDPRRVGIYGGSYGGFMTLMALFRAPGEFAAGAALRPVTDWMQYEHEYTSNILNDPQTDPIAYARSSPLEFAAGLQDPLLICHGVIDDNVLFEDSMRLYQRLIELHKDDFTISPYPLDRHGFTNADSWLDEYRRILRLFEMHLEGRETSASPAVSAGTAAAAGATAAGSNAAVATGLAATPAFDMPATIRELMEGEVDPAADALWDSVAYIASTSGVEDRRPRTDEEWQAVRAQALTLIEAANLLAMPGRRAAPADTPVGPGELAPAQIQRLIDTQHARFTEFARVLQAAGRGALEAIDARDADALMNAGTVIDAACEACHVVYWYPNQNQPAN
jgi:dipeptidyl aminopeptidase/acylaminoacyl peptidase/cytochrome c556